MEINISHEQTIRNLKCHDAEMRSTIEGSQLALDKSQTENARLEDRSTQQRQKRKLEQQQTREAIQQQQNLKEKQEALEERQKSLSKILPEILEIVKRHEGQLNALATGQEEQQDQVSELYRERMDFEAQVSELCQARKTLFQGHEDLRGRTARLDEDLKSLDARLQQKDHIRMEDLGRQTKAQKLCETFLQNALGSCPEDDGEAQSVDASLTDWEAD